MLWEKAWNKEANRLLAVSDEGKVRIATACIDWVMSKYATQLSAVLPISTYKVLAGSLDFLWDSADKQLTSLHLRQQAQMRKKGIEAIVPDEDEGSKYISHFDCLALSLYYAMDCLLKAGPEWCRHAIEQSYQFDWFQEVYSQTTTPMKPTELNKFVDGLEAQLCAEHLDYQIQCLQRVEAGQSIKRLTSPQM